MRDANVESKCLKGDLVGSGPARSATAPAAVEHVAVPTPCRQAEREMHPGWCPAFGLEARLGLRSHTHSLQLNAYLGPEQLHDFQFVQTRRHESREERLLAVIGGLEEVGRVCGAYFR